MEIKEIESDPEYGPVGGGGVVIGNETLSSLKVPGPFSNYASKLFKKYFALWSMIYLQRKYMPYINST
jgi:hypothetical protein